MALDTRKAAAKFKESAGNGENVAALHLTC